MLLHDAPADAFAGHVREFLVQELCRVGVPLAYEVVVQPLARDPFELTEEVEFRFLSRVTPLGLQQSLGQVKNQRGPAQVSGMDQVEIDSFADDPLIVRDGWSHEVGRERQRGVVVERGREAFFREFDAVARDTWETNLADVAIRGRGLDLHGFSRWLRRNDDRLGCKVERDAEHVRVVHVEQAVFVQVVRLPAQCPADDLFAQKLRAEGSYSEHVRNGVGVPALGQHRYGNDATGRFAKPSRLADGVHDFA